MVEIIEHKKQTSIGVVRVFEMINARGSKVVVSSLGAGIIDIVVPDREGKLSDVVMGYSEFESYVNDGHCAGKTAGRYANRIAKGRFTLDGMTYHLPVNNGPNHLHGGPEGLQNQLWDVEEVSENVIFTHTSPDGHAGYPGNLKLRVIYSWNDDNELTIRYEAQTDSPTVINLINHTYFNLNGHSSGTSLGHRLKLNASNFLPTDDTLIPTGVLAPVAGTPMDFTESKLLGKEINTHFDALIYGKGYDNCWAVDGAPGLKEVAILEAVESGRRLVISSDQPGVQVYTGNWISDTPVGKEGYRYADYDCVAIECQEFPDAPNQPSFPSTVLRSGETYRRTIKFAFSVINF